MMKIFDIMSNDYFRLFVRREGKVVLGRHCSSLWLLTAVLTVTFLAIAFSNGSLDYLAYKMDDPFINWVDIKNDYGEGDFFGLEYGLEEQTAKDRYHYHDYQTDYYFNYMFLGSDREHIQYLKCRFFQDLNTSLVDAILSEDNLYKDCRVRDLSALDPNTIGVIITQEKLNLLGYDEVPAYIDLCRYCIGADTLGFELYQNHGRVPLPVLGVVKRLPGNVDLISTEYCYKQENNDNTYPFDLNNPRYARSLHYFVPSDVDCGEFSAKLEDLMSSFPEADAVVDEYGYYCPEVQSFKDGKFISVSPSVGELPLDVVGCVNSEIMRIYGGKDVHRLYEYEFSDCQLSQKAFISVHFNDLDSIRAFESYVKDNYKVKIEMSQINAKENFNAVSIMANILSWSMIVFAIVCIILFIVNLLQSYFQKVKRNLGTFKAFGISNMELISVYVLIMAATISAAVVLSLAIAFCTQEILPLFGILKDGTFNYLSLWSSKTFLSILVIVAASVSTVYAVMDKLLKSTPGDLIYDRQ